VTPYKYLFAVQKAKIYKIIDELLEAEVIHPDTSPFSSHVVIVLKKEGSWNICLDFWDLNKLRIKGKFPILVIDDLLDELHRAMFLTKLDLFSIYYQIRMMEVNISKTIFYTHEGHYEFLVIPFRLCNSASTLHSLVNKIFDPSYAILCLYSLMIS
jgi:hypothetical protein